MARTAYAVIGAGYGDEGKGVLVDALSARLGAATVVRANGGAQAGHTVVRPDGRRHVFHHIGAGAFAGAATHLSRFFVHSPVVFEVEREAVTAAGGCAAVTADPRGLVTTPWDMLVNQVLEAARGCGRHGSCGLGFGETIERSQRPAFRLTIADLTAPDLRSRLEAIRRAWIPRRLAALGLTRLGPREAALVCGDAVMEVFLDDCARFAEMVILASDTRLARRGPVVFEAAQGLLLDPSIGEFPHVTRSCTGLGNIVAVAQEAGLDAIEATYVTRAYATRHGAGPLPGGADRLEGFVLDEPTNAPNAWQGAMRYAPLDVERLAEAIDTDLALVRPGGVRIRRRLAVTCLDQARGPIRVTDGVTTQDWAPETLAGGLARRLGLSLHAEGWGPARADVRLAGAGVGVT